MKMFLSFIAVGLIFTASLTFDSCSKSDSNSTDTCVTLAAELTDAAAVYITDPTNPVVCNAYKSAIGNYLNGCDALSDEERADFQEAYDSLLCE